MTIDDIHIFLNKHWGDTASVAGLFLSLGGFALTIRAARRAELAAERTRKSLVRFNVLVEASQAVAELSEITRCHRAEQWQSLPDRYAAIKGHLISIKSPASTISEQQRLVVAGVLKQLSDIDAKVESSLATRSNSGPLKQIPMLEILKTQADHLNELLADLRQESGDSNEQ